MMMRVPLGVVLLLAASAHSHGMYSRVGCGCHGDTNSKDLVHEETTQLRGYVQKLGVSHYEVLTDVALQAYFRFKLINAFPDVVPSTRDGYLTVVSESLDKLTDKALPSVSQCGEIAGYLQKSVPELVTAKVSIDLRALVASTSLVLYERGISVSLQQLNVLLKTGLSAYLQSSAHQSAYGSLVQLIATLDHIDHNLPNILDQEYLIEIRRAVETRFNLDREMFKQRYKLAIKAYETSRRRILSSFNTLAYRGPHYETTVQYVVKQLVQLFPNVQAFTARIIINVLKQTNSGGSKGDPKDLLAIINALEVDSSMRNISVISARTVFQYLPSQHKGISIVQIQEAYGIFLIGLLSQGYQPLTLEGTYQTFVHFMQQFFQNTQFYTIKAYFVYVLRVVAPNIGRGSLNWRIYSFDTSIVVENVLIPKSLQSIYRKGRDTIIASITGLQGNSGDIKDRLRFGEGEKAEVDDIVHFKPDIVAGPVPTYDEFAYQDVVLSAIQLKRIATVLVQRFNQLKQPSLQLPLLRILLRANVISDLKGDRAAAAFRRIFTGLPQFVAPSNLQVIITELSEHRLQLTETQLLAGLQLFHVASRCLGYTIPQEQVTSVFVYTVRLYLQGLTTIPDQPFDDDFLQFVRLRLTIIIKQVTIVNQDVTIDSYQAQQIFSVIDIRISIEIKQILIKWISSSPKLHPRPVKGVSVVSQYQSLLKALLARYSSDIFILPNKDLDIIRSQLYKENYHKINIEYVRTANFMTYLCLGLLNRLDSSYTVVRFRQLVYGSIRYFLRVNKVSSIATTRYIRVLLHQYSVPLPELPVDHKPVIQVDDYIRPPVYILRGISLRVELVQEIVVILKKRFHFVVLENVQTIIAHTVLILRSSGVKVVQKNCFEHVVNFYNGLPDNVALGDIDLEYLVKKIDTQLVGSTISGIGIQSSLVELYIHMYYRKMPIPSVEVVNDFFSFFIGAYGKTKVRRQIPFGKPFFAFCNRFLPKLPGYLKPFPLFAAPKIYNVFYSKLQTPIYAVDIYLYLTVVRRVTKISLTVGSLKRVISGVTLVPELQHAEMRGLLSFVKERNIKVTRVQLIRAFTIYRLSVSLIKVKITRVQLISVFQTVLYSSVKNFNTFLVVGYIEQIIVRLRKYKVELPAPTPRPCKGGHFFGCGKIILEHNRRG